MAYEFQADAFPEAPGVYRMRSASGEVIYIGKAKDLRSRLSQYFAQRHDGRYQIDLLLRDVKTVETVVTPSEREALILENQLIKREKPRYNIRLKDDKTYPYLRLSKDPFPRIDVSRQRDEENYEIFGPYTEVASAHRLLEVICSQFGVRRCPGIPLKLLDRPCLYAQIGQCSAPCVKAISEEDYGQAVARSRSLLQGKTGSLVQEARKNMEEASEALEFEKAARFRDLMAALQNFERGGVLEGGRHDSVDIIAHGHHRGWDVVVLLQVRSAQLWANEAFQRRALGPWEEEAASFMMEIYGTREIPPQVVMDFEMNDRRVMAEILSDRAERKVDLRRPQRGALRSWLSMARQNLKAEISCRDATGHLDREDYLESIRAECDLPLVPKFAIALDCANFSLEEPVGCIVSFLDGRPDRKGYRKFKVKGEEVGDVHHVQEVITRYLKKNPLPDLLLIDGGVEQLKATARAMETLGIEVDGRLVGISKGEERRRGEEVLHFWGREETLGLDQAPLSMPFFTHLRDEAHRTSNRFNGSRMSKRRINNPFSSIPGIGAVGSKVLRRHFGSMVAFLEGPITTVDELDDLNQRQRNMLKAYWTANQEEG